MRGALGVSLEQSNGFARPCSWGRCDHGTQWENGRGLCLREGIKPARHASWHLLQLNASSARVAEWVQPSVTQHQTTGIFLDGDSASSTWKHLLKVSQS